MIKINKKEKEYLVSNGVPYGENGVSISGNRRSFYLCESQRNINLLNQYKKLITSTK